MAEKEVPGAIEDDGGMRQYYGYMKHHRYHVYVPTTIFDPKAALIRVYKVENHSKQLPDSPEEIIGQKWVLLKSLPTWDSDYRCFHLSRRDEKKIRRAVDNLERKLERDK
ncbi:hypothetical protein HY485_04190 [Candidatus Woesearchaeota archaeon]|nr:hypothetical protein [Candidatus Woesearchaeota archaeon]